MTVNVGKKVEEIRHKMSMNQGEFGKFFDVSAMTVSRWERGGNPPGARELLILGRLAHTAGFNGWRFWQLAGITRADCERALNSLNGRVARAGASE